MARGVGLWAFAVGSDRLYYLREISDNSAEIRQYLFAGGADSRLARVDKPLTSGLSLSPEGKSLLYAEWRRRGSLMIAENLR